MTVAPFDYSREEIVHHPHALGQGDETNNLLSICLFPPVHIPKFTFKFPLHLKIPELTKGHNMHTNIFIEANITTLYIKKQSNRTYLASDEA